MMTPAVDLPMLRSYLKSAEEGRGQVRRFVQECAFPIGERGFTTLIVTCGRLGSWKKAVEIFEVMPSQGVQPNSFTYGALISVCCNASKWERALRFFDEMKAAAVDNRACTPDTLVYKNLVPACAKHGKFDVVLRLYDEMLKEDVQAEKQTLSWVLEACMRRRQWSKAAQLLDESHARDQLLSPRCYTKLISACADHGDLDQALEFFLTMQMVGLSANTYSCRGLMRAIESAGATHMGISLIDQMREEDIFVSTETYNSLVRLLAKAGEWDLLVDVITDMNSMRVGISMESGAVITRYFTQLTDCKTDSIVASKIKSLGIAVDSEAQGWSIKVGSPLARRWSDTGSCSSQ